MPLELRSEWHRNAQGEPLCFGYNTAKQCDLAKDGERCSKGWHLCAEPKCLQPHGLLQHKKSGCQTAKDWPGFLANQCFMIEVFSGTATLGSVAKQYGLDASMALDKVRK